MTAQKHIRLDDDVVKLVDDWRRAQSPIPSFNTAINTMLKPPKLYVTIQAVAEETSKFLLAHEADIAEHEEDYGDLWTAFRGFIGREPLTQYEQNVLREVKEQ